MWIEVFDRFKNEELSPDMMAQEQKRKDGKMVNPADGRDVWNPDEPNKKPEKEGDKMEKNDNEKRPASPEEMRERMRLEYWRIELAVSENPDWPPAKWNPEAEIQLAWDLEKWLNSVV